MLRFAFLFLLFLPSFVLGEDSLVEKLRAGGYVLYLRHTSTDFSRNDAKSRSYEDCENQRNLTDKGRAEARELAASHGNPFRALAGPPYLAEGEIAVVRPEGGGKFSVVSRIRLEEWPKL